MLPPAPPPAFQPDSRERNLAALTQDTFDVLIVGGGINGAGLARDLALRAQRSGRGFRIALIDKGHFASGTSSRNSQLIHGGLRYLKQLEFGLVREALAERATLLEIAPHLVEPLPLLIPFPSLAKRLFYRAGLVLYDLLAGPRNIGRRHYLTREQLRAIEPHIAPEGLHSAGIYYDARVHSSRLVLENLFDAARAGVIAANYVEAGPWTYDGALYRVPCRDVVTSVRFEVRARRIADARGPWEGSTNVRLVRGSHIVLPRVNASDHAIAHFNPDGRILFIIPWGPGRSLSLVGTTDVDHEGSPDDARISPAEIAYLQRSVRAIFPWAHLEPIAAYSSLRPLVSSGDSATSASRSHKIWLTGDNILKITGGKYTTYRSMSEEGADLLLPDSRGQCVTAKEPVGGNSAAAFEAELAEAATRAREFQMDQEEVLAVTRMFGRQTKRVLELAFDAPEPVTRAEAAVIAYAVRHEMAGHLPDVLFVSTYWGHERPWTSDSLLPYARAMGTAAGWDDRRVSEEVELALRVGGRLTLDALSKS